MALLQTNSFNAMSKKIAQTRREILLNAIHDGFTPLEAMLIWKMTRAQVDIMTASMRKKGMIVAGGGTRSRIFLKVKEKCKSSFLMND